MNNLGNNIYAYFLAHFAELPLDKQLHFASRTYLWIGDERSKTLIEEIRPRILPQDDVIASLCGIADGSLIPLRYGSKNALALRKPYFEHYPRLRSSAAVLHWSLLFDTLYDTDARSQTHKILPKAEAEKLYAELVADEAAIAALSTYAVNYLYLYRRYMQQDDSGLEPSFLLAIADRPERYDLSDQVERQLYIYLLTHSVIAESLFYSRQLPGMAVDGYKQMMSQLETIIRKRFATINLDNKLEFLVCCQLCHYTTELRPTILEEVEQSLSPDGGIFIIDHKSPYSSFEKSEHRNVLYLMATTNPVPRLQAS